MPPRCWRTILTPRAVPVGDRDGADPLADQTRAIAACLRQVARRQRRVGESRAPLRASLEAFEALGLVPFAACAREELRASGQTRARKADYSWDQLSSQEREIAQLASSGLSNREIGQRLYVSDRTVGSHLYRLFPKLGVTSRSQLRDVMEAVGT